MPLGRIGIQYRPGSSAGAEPALPPTPSWADPSETTHRMLNSQFGWGAGIFLPVLIRIAYMTQVARPLRCPLQQQPAPAEVIWSNALEYNCSSERWWVHFNSCFWLHASRNACTAQREQADQESWPPPEKVST